MQYDTTNQLLHGWIRTDFPDYGQSYRLKQAQMAAVVVLSGHLRSQAIKTEPELGRLTPMAPRVRADPMQGAAAGHEQNLKTVIPTHYPERVSVEREVLAGVG